MAFIAMCILGGIAGLTVQTSLTSLLFESSTGGFLNGSALFAIGTIVYMLNWLYCRNRDREAMQPQSISETTSPLGQDFAKAGLTLGIIGTVYVALAIPSFLSLFIRSDPVYNLSGFLALYLFILILPILSLILGKTAKHRECTDKNASNAVILGAIGTSLTFLMILFSVVIILSAVGFNSFSYNSNEGSGLCENEEYLKHLSTDEILGIVLVGDYYLLPEPLHHFIENGWRPTTSTLLLFEELSTVFLPAGTYMEIELTKDNMQIYLDVVNQGSENIVVMDAMVTRLLTIGAEKDQAVIIGGITINTSSEDVVNSLQNLNISYNMSRGSSSSIFIADEAYYDGRLSIDRDKNTVRAFSIWLGGKYNWEHFDFHFLEISSLAREAAYLSESYYFKGTVIGIYQVEDKDIGLTPNHAVVSKDNEGNLFAIQVKWFFRIDLESINEGDQIIVYYGYQEHLGRPHEMIEYEGIRIPYIRAGVLFINEEMLYSKFRE